MYFAPHCLSTARPFLLGYMPQLGWPDAPLSVGLQSIWQLLLFKLLQHCRIDTFPRFGLKAVHSVGTHYPVHPSVYFLYLLFLSVLQSLPLPVSSNHWAKVTGPPGKVANPFQETKRQTIIHTLTRDTLELLIDITCMVLVFGRKLSTQTKLAERTQDEAGMWSCNLLVERW